MKTGLCKKCGEVKPLSEIAQSHGIGPNKKRVIYYRQCNACKDAVLNRRDILSIYMGSGKAGKRIRHAIESEAIRRKIPMSRMILQALMATGSQTLKDELGEARL